MLRFVFITGFLLSFLTPYHPADAQVKKQSNGKGPAYTAPPKDNLSFELMGEFVGEIADGEQTRVLGLQIRTIGKDQFDALAFFGGLPGEKNHEPKPVQMIGKRSGDFVILSGGPWAVILETYEGRILDREGNKIGQLKRVRRRSSTLFAPPPEGALVLFDGSNVDQFNNGKMSEQGWLMEGADIKPMFQDFNLHVEFRLPYMPVADDQKRGNSGLYLQGRYECQVLDSFGQLPKINGCGALYRFKAPDFNMCLPPLTWQTYDVQFTAPRWNADGSKRSNARITSWVNGIKVQDNVELKNKTGAGKPEGPFLSPIKIQNHGDPVRFRNIWIVDRGLATGEFPVVPNSEQYELAAKSEQDRLELRAEEKRLRQLEAQKAKEAREQAALELEKKQAELKALEAELERLIQSVETEGEDAKKEE